MMMSRHGLRIRPVEQKSLGQAPVDDRTEVGGPDGNAAPDSGKRIVPAVTQASRDKLNAYREKAPDPTARFEQAHHCGGFLERPAGIGHEAPAWQVLCLRRVSYEQVARWTDSKLFRRAYSECVPVGNIRTRKGCSPLFLGHAVSRIGGGVAGKGGGTHGQVQCVDAWRRDPAHSGIPKERELPACSAT